MLPLDQLIFSSVNVHNDNNRKVRSFSDEKKCASTIVTVLNGKGSTVISVRLYHGTDKTACVVRLWPSDDRYHASLETCIGYGFDRSSVALAMTLESMGIEWNVELSGRGLSDTIFKKLAASIGYPDVNVLTVYARDF